MRSSQYISFFNNSVIEKNIAFASSSKGGETAGTVAKEFSPSLSSQSNSKGAETAGTVATTGLGGSSCSSSSGSSFSAVA